MIDARIAVTLPSHPKTKKLIRRLGDGAAWKLVCLFLWAAANRPNGDLSGLAAEDIEIAVDWAGEEGVFVRALIDVGFLDGEPGAHQIHDWSDHNAWSAGSDMRSAKARWNAIKRYHGEAEADREVPEWAEKRAAINAGSRSSNKKSTADSNADSSASSNAASKTDPATCNAPSPSPSPSPSLNTSVANATGGEPPKPPLPPDEIIFGYGVPLLTSSGTVEKQARSFLGGLRKQHGDHALIDALRECLRAKPLQPVEWLAARLPPAARARASPARTPVPENFDSKDYGTGGLI